MDALSAFLLPLHLSLTMRKKNYNTHRFAADDEAGHLRELSRSSTSGGGGLRTALSGLSAYASGACTPVGLSAASAVPQAERANSQL
jgi:hypothetical protein